MKMVKILVCIALASLTACGPEEGEVPHDLDLSTAEFELSVSPAGSKSLTKASKANTRVSRKDRSQRVRPGTVAGGLPNPDVGGPNTGPVKEICDYPMGRSSVSGRCQVGTVGGGTQECDCEAEINTSHDTSGSCKYEVIDLVVVGNCDGGDGGLDQPPIDSEAGF